ncbi:hypothetical protein D3C84_1056570 [compost metagenome]
MKISPRVAPISPIPLLQNKYDSQDGKITRYARPSHGAAPCPRLNVRSGCNAQIPRLNGIRHSAPTTAQYVTNALPAMVFGFVRKKEQ